jgi:hypothetical protein
VSSVVACFFSTKGKFFVVGSNVDDAIYAVPVVSEASVVSVEFIAESASARAADGPDGFEEGLASGNAANIACTWSSGIAFPKANCFAESFAATFCRFAEFPIRVWVAAGFK